MAHFHSDMKRFDIHVAPEACDIVPQSATILTILESSSNTARRVRVPEFFR